MKYAKWIADDVIAGSFHNKKILIKKGEVRKILVEKDGCFILEGSDLGRTFGWINPEEIQILDIKLVN